MGMSYLRVSVKMAVECTGVSIKYNPAPCYAVDFPGCPSQEIVFVGNDDGTDVEMVQ